MQLDWTKCGRDWFGIWGKFRADVRGPNGPLGMCHWSVCAGDRRGGSGGTSSIVASKRAAESEVMRFAKWLREQKAPNDCGMIRENESAQTPPNVRAISNKIRIS